MKKFKLIFSSILFNVVETIVIYLIGMLLDLPNKYIIMIVLTFLICRGFFGVSIHFKTWYRCLIWSSLIMLSLFVLFKVDFIISIMFAAYSALILTGKSDISDMYLWKNKGEPDKYQDIFDYIKYNEFEDRLIDFERKLEAKNSMDYLIYKYRFKDNKTYGTISELLDIDGPRISEHLERIALAIRIYCRI